MKREFELKAALPDDGTALRERLSAAGWRLTFEGEMSDRRYDTSDRALESRDEVLRLRRMRADSGEKLAWLGWKGAASVEEGYKVRAELETPVDEGDTTAGILERLGYAAVTLAIDRRIAIYEKAGVHARIEAYPRMDTLVEVEGDPSEIEARLGDLGLPRDAWKPWPLDEFVRRYEERTGTEARLSGTVDRA